MSVKIHTTKVYDVQYGSTIDNRLTDDIIRLIRRSETGYVSDDEEELEIDRDELRQIRQDCSSDVQDAIDTILEECDPENDFVHLSIF